MIGKIVLGLWIAHLSSFIVSNVGSTAGEVRLVDESLDERNDAELFRAVYKSMRDFEARKQRRGHRSKREVSRVCYEDVGCFEDTGPFSYLEMLPSPPKEVGTRFFVYGSRKARSIPMEVPADSITDKANNAIDPELPTKVIVHGFGSSCDHIWVYEMRSALMAVIECNIVCVDWGPGSAVPNYVRAAANTRLVGRQLAKLIRSLNVSLDKVHLIGFSLGAHVAGFAGAELGNVSRITGLDPAGPLFESQDPRARLDETDAQYVDVIHSNGEQLILGGLGSWQPMGDVDFYPNGGRMQTGCSNLFLGAVSDIIWSSPVEGRSLCNHRRAYKLFTDSISPKCRFPAFPCESGYDGLLKGECFPCGTHPEAPCGNMGFYSDKTPARGQLYLVTRDEEPFCAHQYQVKVYNSRHERPVKSYGKLQVTLIAEGLMNETFTMTKKEDEELHVGKTLQKIVVPRPVLSNLDAIEIKYTAYSGWISSGLVSWAIDKVSVVDSYGTLYSVCKRGLILGSGRPVYLPLYQGDCIVDDNATSSSVEEEPQSSEPTKEDSKQKSIGPFTRDQNYEINSGKDSFTNEVPQKGLGPFTKEENLKIAKEQASKDFADNSSDGKTYQSVSSPWSLAELSNDGASNSVENNIGVEFAERGRGFSGLAGSASMNLAASISLPPLNPTAISNDQDGSTSSSTEVLEPALRLGGASLKKEMGRSLKLPEIKEPVLRLRGTRQDNAARSNGELQMEDRKHELLEESSSSRGFTVQFLPERLAEILAQAERYARQTLLPLISQYTPSFIGGGRAERPKYFPPLVPNSHQEDTSNIRKYHVSIQRDYDGNNPNSGIHFCSGAIVGDIHVLTSSWCFASQLNGEITISMQPISGHVVVVAGISEIHGSDIIRDVVKVFIPRVHSFNEQMFGIVAILQLSRNLNVAHHTGRLQALQFDRSNAYRLYEDKPAIVPGHGCGAIFRDAHRVLQPQPNPVETRDFLHVHMLKKSDSNFFNYSISVIVPERLQLRACLSRNLNVARNPGRLQALQFDRSNPYRLYEDKPAIVPGNSCGAVFRDEHGALQPRENPVEIRDFLHVHMLKKRDSNVYDYLISAIVPERLQLRACVDHGSPLVYQNMIIGVLSHHRNENDQMAFSRVSRYSDFIERAMQVDGNRNDMIILEN